MVKKEGPIDELKIFSPDGETVTEEAVQAALTKAAHNPVFVKEFVKKIKHAHTTGTGMVAVATTRNGAG